jgi:hypothetical protein
MCAGYRRRHPGLILANYLREQRHRKNDLNAILFLRRRPSAEDDAAVALDRFKSHYDADSPLSA